MNFANFLRIPFLQNTSERLLQNIYNVIKHVLLLLLPSYSNRAQWKYQPSNVRSSCPEVFCKKGVLRNFTKSTGNTCATVSFLIKLQAGACNFVQKETLGQVFSCEFCQISKDTSSPRTLLVAGSETFLLLTVRRCSRAFSVSLIAFSNLAALLLLVCSQMGAYQQKCKLFTDKIFCYFVAKRPQQFIKGLLIFKFCLINFIFRVFIQISDVQ